MTKSWHGRICYEGEGIVEEKTFNTWEEAQAYCLGFDAVKNIDEEGFMDGYFSCVSQEESAEE